MESVRETSNFFKHADRDHELELHVANIADLNILQLGLCIVNYHGLFGELTDHMRVLFGAAKFHSPDSFVMPDQREKFEAALPLFRDMTLADYLNDCWNDPLVREVFPNLASERTEDLQDTFPLYAGRIGDMGKRKKT
jgi:hypothetical protein